MTLIFLLFLIRYHQESKVPANFIWPLEIIKQNMQLKESVPHKCIFILTIIISFFIFSLGAYSQGLKFYANDRLIAERTSYSVFEKRGETFENSIEVNFELTIQDIESFGYVLHIEDQLHQTFYNLTHAINNSELSSLMLNAENQENIFNIPIPKSDLGIGNWHKLSIKLDAVNNLITLVINDKAFTSERTFKSKVFDVQIFFGKKDIMIDVPDMAIRNLEVIGSAKRYFFKFNEIDGTDVHNNDGKVIGKVENPYWLINDSYYWEKRKQFYVEDIAFVTFDKANQRFLILSEDSLIVYSTNIDDLKRQQLPQRIPIVPVLGTGFFRQTTNEFFVYELYSFPPESPKVAALQMDSLSWKIYSYDTPLNIQHHHTGHLIENESQFLIFGGFGNASYTSSFFSMNLENASNWDKIEFSGDSISPRFFSGMLKFSEDQLLLFAGAGNPTGNQALGKIYYTDSYIINLSTKTIKKQWENSDFAIPEVSSRNMVLAPDSAHFYTIYYPEYVPNTHLKLHKFSISDGKWEILGDSIPMNSERIETNANLYLNVLTKEIFCVTQEFQPNGSSVISVYSIGYPPVSEDSFFHGNEVTALNPFVIAIFIFILIVLGLVAFYVKRSRNLRKQKLNLQQIKAEMLISKNQVEVIKKVNSVYLFGEFLAYDKKGMEISHLFSPKIKQLFLLILFNSDKTGVSSYDIYSTLWPDKTTDKAKNSKGVTLNQLRKILADFDGIEIVYENKHLFIKSTSLFYCDYLHFKNLIILLSGTTVDSETELQNLIQLIAKGPFLANSDFDNFDAFKNEFENEILQTIPIHLEKCFENEKFLISLGLARIIRKLDELNELVLYYELACFSKLDLLEKAKKRYNSFSIKYKKETSTDFEHSFRELYEGKAIKLIKEKSFF